MSVTLVLSAERMLSYLPPYWHEYEEIIRILEAEGAELDDLDSESDYILTDAFILTMRESRVEEWEKWLGLPPTGTLDDRRQAILMYFAVIAKMTRESIQVLVSQLYNGARAEVVFKDSTVHITIKPLPEHDDEPIDFQLLLDQLKRRKPCHISLFTKRWYCSWGDIKNGFNTWQAIKDNRKNWQHVYDYIPN